MKIFGFLLVSENRYECGSFAKAKQHKANFGKARDTRTLYAIQVWFRPSSTLRDGPPGRRCHQKPKQPETLGDQSFCYKMLRKRTGPNS